MGQILNIGPCSFCAKGQKEEELQKLYKKRLIPEPTIKRHESDNNTLTTIDETKQTEPTDNNTENNTDNNTEMNVKTMELLSHSDDDNDNNDDNNNNDNNDNNDSMMPPNDPSINKDNTVSFELCKHERNVSDVRIKQLHDIHNLNELEKALTEQYDNIPDTSDAELNGDDNNSFEDDDDDDKSSSYSDEELAEIEKIKSEKIKLNENDLEFEEAHLIRPNTKRSWTVDQIYSMEKDMEKQLEELRSNSVDFDNLTPNINRLLVPKTYTVKITGSDDWASSDDDNNDKHKKHKLPANLFRNKSKRKWNLNEVEEQHFEMEKEMLHLVREQSQKKTSTSKQSV